MEGTAGIGQGRSTGNGLEHEPMFGPEHRFGRTLRRRPDVADPVKVLEQAVSHVTLHIDPYRQVDAPAQRRDSCLGIALGHNSSAAHPPARGEVPRALGQGESVSERPPRWWSTRRVRAVHEEHRRTRGVGHGSPIMAVGETYAVFEEDEYPASTPAGVGFSDRLHPGARIGSPASVRTRPVSSTTESEIGFNR